MVKLRPESSSLPEILDRILDKGVVIDSNVRVSFSDFDLLGINAIVILSHFKTAGKIGLEFPEGVNLNTPAWKDMVSKQPCPLCGKEWRTIDLKKEGCPWCGWNYSPKYNDDSVTFEEERKSRYIKISKSKKGKGDL